MISFGQVDEFEVNGKGLGHPVSFSDRQIVNNLGRTLHQILFRRSDAWSWIVTGMQVSMPDSKLSQFLNRLKQGGPGLLREDLTEQPTKRAHIPA